MRRDGGTTSGAPTYGSYFDTVVRFLQADDFRRLRRSVSHTVGPKAASGSLGDISIFLEKHGAFYHPARIRIDVAGKTIQLVVNAAFSAEGKKAIAREVACIEVLQKQYAHTYLPRIYAFGSAPDSAGEAIPMFLGQWFSGYHEFHPVGGRIRVWDPKNDRLFLSGHQTAALYRQIARILTAYYHFETFQQIAFWHLAAGDFVVRITDGDVDVRLITVRDYRPLFELEEEEDTLAGMTMDALLVFFLNMLLHIRIDRIDGVGKTVVAPFAAVSAAAEGFFQGAADWDVNDAFKSGLLDAFRHYVHRISPEDLTSLHEDIAAHMAAGSEQRQTVEKHLQSHVGDVLCIIGAW